MQAPRRRGGDDVGAVTSYCPHWPSGVPFTGGCPECRTVLYTQTVQSGGVSSTVAAGTGCPTCGTDQAEAAALRAKLELAEAALEAAATGGQVPCLAARPGEGTYECRHDRLCAACRLRAKLAEAERVIARATKAYVLTSAKLAEVEANAQRHADLQAMAEGRAASLSERLEAAEGRAAAIVESSACWEADYREAVRLLGKARWAWARPGELDDEISAFLGRKGGG